MREDDGPAAGAAWRARLPRLLLPRLRRAPAPVASAAAPDNDALVPFARDGQPPLPVLFAAVQGLDPAELEAAVAGAQAGAATAGVHALFLSDHDDLLPFRRRRALVERLPPPAELARLAPPDEAAIYLARRLVVLCRKWRPLRIVPHGEAAAAWLAAVGRTPEAEPLAGLLAGAPDREGS